MKSVDHDQQNSPACSKDAEAEDVRQKQLDDTQVPATTQSQSQKENPMASYSNCKGTVTQAQASINHSAQHAAENVSTTITPLRNLYRTATNKVPKRSSINIVSPTRSVAQPFTSAKRLLSKSMFPNMHKRTSNSGRSSEVKREHASDDENIKQHNTAGKQSLEAMPVDTPVASEVCTGMEHFREQLRAAYAAGATEQQQTITPAKTRKPDSCFKSDTLLSSSTSDTDRRTSRFLRRQRNARLHSAPHRKTKTTKESTGEPTSSSTCSDSSSTDS